MTAERLPGPVIWAIGGALVAVVGFLWPQCWFGAAAMTVSDDVPFIAVALVSFYAQRVMQGCTHGGRLWAALMIAGVTALSVGGAAYWLYSIGRPALLAARFARRLASDKAHAAELALHPSSWLDPVNQSLQLAASVLIVGFLVGSFAAFRVRVAERHRAVS